MESGLEPNVSDEGDVTAQMVNHKQDRVFKDKTLT